MSRSHSGEILLGVAVIGLVGFVVTQAFVSHGRTSGAAAGVLSTDDSARVAETYRAQLEARGVGSRVPDWLAAVHIAHLQAAASRGPAPSDDAQPTPAAPGALTSPGTYLATMLAEDGNVLTRWRTASEPIWVWVQPHSTERGFTPSLVATVRRGFMVWNEVDLGVHFAIVDDSTRADVHVTWSAVMPKADQIGSTFRMTDHDGWMLLAHVALSSVHDIHMVQNAARHEAGHVLGLGHSPAGRDIMAATTEGQQYELTEADRRTAQLLYRLPAGRVPER